MLKKIKEIFCLNCNSLTEKDIHCNQLTIFYRGVKWIDNSMVNLMSNIATIIIAVLLSALFIF